MNQKQELLSEFFQTMLKMRKILDREIDFSNNSGDGKISTLLQMQALEQIKKHSQITAGELASCLQMSSSSLTQLTNRLINAKLISRVRGTADRRAIYLVLTTLGKKHLRETMKLIESKTTKIFAPMSRNDLKEILRIFNNILEKQKQK